KTLCFKRAARHIAGMSEPRKSSASAKVKKPRTSRTKSGKPTPPPVETAAGTPGLREAPQAPFDSGTLPALRAQALQPTRGTGSMTAYLDALLAKPHERSASARELLKQQPMLASHPIVAGAEIDFVPHRPP